VSLLGEVVFEKKFNPKYAIKRFNFL